MRVALTGHRPQRLGLPEDETDEKWIPIQHWIIDELSNFIKTCNINSIFYLALNYSPFNFHSLMKDKFIVKFQLLKALF